MKTLLALQPKNPICFGPFCNQLNNPVVTAGIIISKLIQLVLIIGGLFLLLYLMLGAYDWIMSGGEKEKIAKAQQKITHAVVGMLILFCAFTVWGFITGDILGIFKKTSKGWEIKLPQF